MSGDFSANQGCSLKNVLHQQRQIIPGGIKRLRRRKRHADKRMLGQGLGLKILAQYGVSPGSLKRYRAPGPFTIWLANQMV